MGQLSVGEDLFAVLVVVSIAIVFSAGLAHSYHIHAERVSTYERFDLALDIAEQLKNNVLAGPENSVTPGLITSTVPTGLADYHRLLAAQGIEVRVEVRGLDDQPIWSYGHEPGALSRYFSPPCSVSLPVAVARGQGSARLGELIVRVWRS